jgi:hypothetical protein
MQVNALPSHAWFRADLPPGRYEVRCTTPEASSATEVDLQPGNTKFIEAGARMGVFAHRCAVEENRAARAAIEGGR